mmetsp:Transcript_35683/g.58515  ORF Transcript_35683/g.58515 Transcript_35683/m.58515 type:complete len:819 (+) Transcript_35683:184-2640(+)
MFSAFTKSSNTMASKLLSEPRPESKSPEPDPVPQSSAERIASKAKSSSSSSPAVRNVNQASSSSKPRASPLSVKAQKVKQSLRSNQEVDAVLIKPDGSLQQIKYNGSSKQAKDLLNGRPTIVGELEGIQTVIVRALNQSNCGAPNQSVLPVPFCNRKFNGNYLLYRVDAEGSPTDLNMALYEKFVAQNKTLTEQAQKNFNPIDAQEIRAKSAFNSNSRLTLVYLRSEVDKKIREEYIQKNGQKPKDADIEGEVDKALQKLVDELVNRSTPMNDPDYDPSEDSKSGDDQVVANLRRIYKDETGADLNGKDIFTTLNRAQNLLAEERVSASGAAIDAFNNELVDERDWRLQLNDALAFVRERGRLDGRMLAEKVSETFYELNGAEPTVDQLVGVFRRIKQELADEAEADLLENEEDAMDDGSAFYLAKKLGPDFSDADPTEIVEYALRIVQEDLVSRAKSSFMISKGRRPNKPELRDTVERLALKLAERALDSNAGTRTIDAIEEDEDADYDPNNIADKRLAKQDALENARFDEDFFNLRMLTTERTKSRLGRAEAYDVYFCKFGKKRLAKNLERAIATFKLRNKREPNQIEVSKIRQFISCKENTNLVQFKLAVVTDDDQDQAKDDEKREIASGAASKKASVSTTPSKVLITPVKKKATAARYAVYFADSKKSVNNDKNFKFAIKWFQRFHSRQPTEFEMAAIKQFVNTDKSELTECEYQVPVDSKDDDRKDTEADDMRLVRKLNMKQNKVIKKGNTATGYTLDFSTDKERENGDLKSATRWFMRFNNRKPSKAELKDIQKFIKRDLNASVEEDTVDID